MRIFTVAHTFKAEEDVELTVRKGESVQAVDNVIQDGWIKVRVRDDTSRQGFVPMSYLKEVSASSGKVAGGESSGQRSNQTTPRRPAAASSGKVPSGESPPVEAGTALDVSSVQASPYQSSPARLASPERVTPPVEQSQPLQPTTLTPAQAASGPVSRTLLKNPDAVVESFMKNEVYFKQLMRKRAEAITGMQNSLEEAMTEVAACKDRNAALARKLRELDQAVEREHQRWNERVLEEKDYISRSLAYTNGSGSLLALDGGFTATSPSPRSTPQRSVV